MTAKRFTFHHDVDGVDYIEDESNGFCLICDELMCSLLNELHEENDGLKKQITSLEVELDTHKHPLWSTREAERKVSQLTDLLSNETKKNAILLEEINSLRKENMRLKEVQKY